MHPTVDRFDAAVERAVDTVRRPLLDAVMYPVSSAADHSLLWFIVGTGLSVRRGDLRFAARFAIAMGLESAATNGPLKSVFRRSRPEPQVAEGPLPFGMRRPITSSFPSGHATAAFTAAVLLADRHPGPWYALAAVVAGSRVYVGMHHASDVVVGGAFGLAFGHTLKRWVGAPRRHPGEQHAGRTG
jgi:undecaprenyl-diphosphatase